MKGKNFLFVIVGLILLSGCTKYEKEKNCHLEKMHVKGNVVKIETIVQSTMPLTEIFTNAFDPQYAISTYAGNVTIIFDNHGNVKHSIGYGVDGKKLFDTDIYKPDNDGCYTPGIPIGPVANQNITKISTVSSNEGGVVNVKYYDENELVWTQKATYNKDGSIQSIIKNYDNLSIKTDLIDITYSDTTTFNYLSYDNIGNWTEVEVIYKGVFPKHNHTYKIKRQITYWDEPEKPELISKLKEYNNTELSSTEKTDVVPLGEYGDMSIPHYMALQSKDYIKNVQNFGGPSTVDLPMNYLFMSVYDKNDAYATISVNTTPGDPSINYDNLSAEELKYNEETDKVMEEQYTAMMAQNRTYVLKWLPYQFTSISGRRALRIRYYRYGIGSPIPVYCETFSIQMSDGNMLNVTFSFQSNLYNRFYSDFEKSIQSIRF